MKGVKMLSRKHYISIASIINDSSNKSAFPNHLNKDSLIDDLCKVFARDNNLFDTARFRRACDGV